MGGARLAARALGWACGGALIAGVPSAAAAPALVQIGTFSSPTYVTAVAGDLAHLYVTEQAGRVRVIRDGEVLAAPLLDLTSITESAGNERGLLSVAFAPGKVYVYLTAKAAAATSGTAGEIQVREYAMSGETADPASGRLLLAIRHDEAENHNGGQLQFARDGKLWLGTGDGGGGNDQFGHAQDPASLLGKLIRLDPAAPVPEIMAVGLRNPWRFSFDRFTGQLVIGDVGQNEWEEIDVGLASNYGWSCREGLHAGPGPACAGTPAEPLLELPHSAGYCSITGGYVVRDAGLPTLNGRYLYTDFCKGELRSVDVTNAASDAGTGLTVDSPTSFGEDACGHPLVVSRAGGVYRIVDGSISPCDPTGGLGPSRTAPRDLRACSLAARVTGLRSVRRSHRLSVALRVDEACQATVSARVAGVTSFKAARAALTAGARTVVRVRLSAAGVRKVRAALRRHRSLRVTVSVQAVDAAGNIRAVRQTARVKG